MINNNLVLLAHGERLPWDDVLQVGFDYMNTVVVSHVARLF